MIIRKVASWYHENKLDFEYLPIPTVSRHEASSRYSLCEVRPFWLFSYDIRLRQFDEGK